MLSSIVPQCGVLKKVHKNQICVLTFRQPLGPQKFSDLQLIEAITSSQSTVVLSDISTVFPPEPKPSTSVTQTASTGGTMKAAILYPFPSILKQGTSDARSSG
jgi:hypothetical protein